MMAVKSTCALLAGAILAGGVAWAGPMRMKADARTELLLEARAGALVDAAGKADAAAMKVVGASLANDATFGRIFRFGETPGRITVADKGRFHIQDGFTVEAWIRFDGVPEKNFGLADKSDGASGRRLFDLRLTKGLRLTVGHVAHESPETIDYTEEGGTHIWPKKLRPLRSYPAHHQTNTNGLLPTETNRWTHVAFTYDAKTGLQRTWVDFGIDREAFYVWRDLAPRVASNPDYPLVLFRDAKHLSVAQVRVSAGARLVGDVPPVRVFVCENAYGGTNYVRVVPVRDDLQLPLEVTVTNLKAPVPAKTFRYRLDDLVAHNFPIPEYVYKNVLSDLVVRLYRNGREIYRWEGAALNPSVANQWQWEFLRNGSAKRGPEHPDWWIEKDCTFTYKRKPIFPLCLYFVRTNAFDQVADLGFNQLMLRADNPKVRGRAFRKAIEPYFEKAAARGITLCPFDPAGRDGAGIRFDLDEPWGYSFDLMRRHYQDIRNARRIPSELPILCTQNNAQRYRETGSVCDVLAPDPYCRGVMPLRFVYDMTRASRREVDGLKPVVTVIGDYGSMRADYEEMRTMCYLAVAGGATGLAFYSWDEGEEPGGKTDTSLMPEQVEIYRRLLAELNALTPALTVPNVSEGPRIEPAAPRGFFPCAKKGRDGKTYVVVCSDLYRTAEKHIVWKPAAGKTAKLVYGPGRGGASRQLVFNADGKATVKLPPLGSAVYAY